MLCQCGCGRAIDARKSRGEPRRFFSNACKQRYYNRNKKLANRNIDPALLNRIFTGDCRDLSKQIPDKSIDLIFTDPPYPKEYLPLYGWLAQEAARVLKPGGFLLAYTGSVYKFEVMTFLGEHLTYFTDIITLAGKQATPLFPQHLSVRHKSILAFTNGHGLPLCKQMQTTLQGGGKDKRFHKWGQDERTALYYIECLTNPDQVVWEPFVGGGTTPYVCAQIDRHYIGFEIDARQAEIARTRLATVQKLLIVEQDREVS